MDVNFNIPTRYEIDDVVYITVNQKVIETKIVGVTFVYKFERGEVSHDEINHSLLYKVHDPYLSLRGEWFLEKNLFGSKGEAETTFLFESWL